MIEALHLAQNHSKQIVEVIEEADDYHDAKAKLMEAFELDYSQAQRVAEMSVIAFCEIEKENLARDLEESRKKLELFRE